MRTSASTGDAKQRKFFFLEASHRSEARRRLQVAVLLEIVDVVPAQITVDRLGQTSHSRVQPWRVDV